MNGLCDDLIKYECSECAKNFIVSAFSARNKNKKLAIKYRTLFCPFCASDSMDVVGPVTAQDNEELLSMLGCLGLYGGSKNRKEARNAKETE